MKNNKYSPEIISESELENFKKDKINLITVDAHVHQIKELFFIENHNYIGMDKTHAYATEDFKNFAEANKNSYVYVYFPWNNCLVKTFPKENYLKLKTNRNQDLITSEEQMKLSNFKVGVFGMSVGSNIAFVLTQAGISNEITIADFDDLDTTNLNRILAGIHQVGTNKCVIAARRIYEDNPFAVVNALTDGISEEILEEKLMRKELDLIIDEIDSIPMKIKMRILGIKYKIPVAMITDNGDGIVYHLERYDLGHEKIFGETISYWESKLKELENPNINLKEFFGGIVINNIVGGIDKVDPNMVKSVARVMKKELVSWSQLGSAAILGGVYATYIIKQVALGKDEKKEVIGYINPSL